MCFSRFMVAVIFVTGCGDSSNQTSRSTTEADAQKKCLSIVNGRESKLKPEVVLLATKNSVCSGVFVSDRALLTAAHCIPEDIQELRYLKGEQIEDFNNSYFLGISAQQALKGTQGNDKESSAGSNDLAVVLFPPQTASAFANISFKHFSSNAQIFGFGLTSLSDETSVEAKKKRVGDVVIQKKSGKNGMYFSKPNLALAAQGDSGGAVFSGSNLIGVLSGTRTSPVTETFAVDLTDQETSAFLKESAEKLNFTFQNSDCN